MNPLKTNTLLLTLGLILLSQNQAANAQAARSGSGQYAQSEQINQVMRFEHPSDNNHITVFNVYGSIDVKGHSGTEVLVTATKQVFADSQKLVDAGRQEIGLKFEQHGEAIYVYLDSPYTYFDREAGLIWHSDTCWRHDDCSRKHVKRKAYLYHMDITVKVPENTNLKVSTINEGDIKITGIAAKTLTVNNINGAIDMVDVAGKTQVNAINKDINITYRTNPTVDSSFESINGDLNISFAGQPNAEVVYQTMHGELYTTYDVSIMAPKVQRISKQKEHGIEYKLDAESRLQVGAGGPEFRFQTLNGDIKIQRQ